MSCRSSFIGIGICSAFINVLTLSGAFYLIQIYGLMFLSQSVHMLIGISFLSLRLFAEKGMPDLVRSLDEQLSPGACTLITCLPLSRHNSLVLKVAEIPDAMMLRATGLTHRVFTNNAGWQRNYHGAHE